MAAFVLAATFPNIIFVIGAAGWGIFASVLFPCVAIGYNWKGATAEGALWGGSVGLVLTLVLAYGAEFAGIQIPFGFLGGQVATVVAVVVFVGVSLVTSTKAYDTVDRDIKFILDMGRLNDGRTAVATDGGTDDSNQEPDERDE